MEGDNLLAMGIMKDVFISLKFGFRGFGLLFLLIL